MCSKAMAKHRNSLPRTLRGLNWLLVLTGCVASPLAIPTETEVSKATSMVTPLPARTSTQEPTPIPAEPNPEPTMPPTAPPPVQLLRSVRPEEVFSQACQVSSLSSIGGLQWDLQSLAWSPIEDTLAYIGPPASPETLVGPLMTVMGPDFDDPMTLARRAAGDPRWSPDSSRIAFVSSRESDGQGTVVVVDADGAGARDLLPGELAHTDPGTGFKSITGWWDERHLVVDRNCGTGCREPLWLDLDAGTLTPFLTFEDLGAVGSRYAWGPGPDRSTVVITSGASPHIGVYARQGNSLDWLSGPYASDRVWASYWTFFTDWAPDSSGFLFLRQPIDGSAYAATAPPALWIWQQATQMHALVLPGVVAAAWSPRGDHIAFLAFGQPQVTPEGVWEGVVATPEGINPLGVGVLRWPQGDLVSFLDAGDLESHNYWPQVQGSLAPIWSPDARHVVYSNGIDSLELLQFAVDQAVHYELTGEGGSGASTATYDVAWSADGHYLAVKKAGTLRIFAIPCQS